MKKAMILASLAAMAITGNAMALQANVGVARNAFLGGNNSGQLVFVPLATLSVGPSAQFPFGACQYSASWNFPTAANPAISTFCQIREAKNATHLNCSANRTVDFATFASTAGVTCTGIDPTGLASTVTMALSEFVGGLDGAGTFDGLGTDFIQIF